MASARASWLELSAGGTGAAGRPSASGEVTAVTSQRPRGRDLRGHAEAVAWPAYRGFISHSGLEFPRPDTLDQYLTRRSARTWAHRVTPGSDEPGLSEIAIYKSLLASANFVDFVTVDDGASAHDAHLDAGYAPSDAALSDYDNHHGQKNA